MHDLFDIHYTEFKKLYRVNEDIVMNLVAALTPRLERDRPSGLSPECQVDYSAFILSYTLQLNVIL